MWQTFLSCKHKRASKKKRKPSWNGRFNQDQRFNPCTDYKRRKSLCRYFSLQRWCIVDDVLSGKTSHVVLTRTKHLNLRWILLGHLGRLLQVPVSDLAPLFSPEESRQASSGLYWCQRSEKWGCSHWFKHVTPLWNVSLLLIILSRSSWCSSVSISSFSFFFWCCCSLFVVVCVTQQRCNHQNWSFFMPVVPGWETRTGGLSSADFTEPRTVQVERKLRSGCEQHRFGSHSHRSTSVFIPWLPFFSPFLKTSSSSFKWADDDLRVMTLTRRTHTSVLLLFVCVVRVCGRVCFVFVRICA